VARLRRRMDNSVRFDFLNDFKDIIPIPDIQFVMCIILDGRFQPVLIPSCIARRSKKDGTLVVINTVDFPSEIRKMYTNLIYV
jgi:hypothetical protein